MPGYTPDHLEALLALERARAELDALRRQALADPDLVEAMRVRAWARIDSARCRLGEGDALLVPDAWPEGVEADSYVLRQIETGARRAALMDEIAALAT